MVGNLLSSGEIEIQDEKTMAMRKNYINLLNMSKYQLIGEILTTRLEDLYSKFFNKITKDKVLKMGKAVLQKNLENNLPNSSLISEYVKEVNDILYKDDDETVKQYLYKIAAIVIFLTGDLANSAKLFKKRMVLGYIPPKLLCEMNYQSKLPEIYFNENVSEEYKGKVLHKIKLEEKEMVDLLGDRLYHIMDPTARVLTRPQIIGGGDINIVYPPLLHTCSNSLSEDFNADNIVLYEDDGKMYCFEIDKLLENRTEVNPHTGNKFSDDFMHFIHEFDNDNIEKQKVKAAQIDTSSDLEKLPEEGEMMVPTLFLPSFINDVNKKYAKLTLLHVDKSQSSESTSSLFKVDDSSSEDESLKESPVELQDSGSSLLDDSSSKKEGAGESGSEESAGESGGESAGEESAGESGGESGGEGAGESGAVSEEELDLSHSFNKTPTVKECHQCKEKFKGNGFKSITINASGPVSLSFCSSKCMELYPFRKPPNLQKKKRVQFV